MSNALPEGYSHTPRRLRAADVIDKQQEVLTALATKTAYTPEPKLELDYKKAPGDSGPRTTWHLEIPAGFDDAEVDRIAAKALALHEALLARYAVSGLDAAKADADRNVHANSKAPG